MSGFAEYITGQSKHTLQVQIQKLDNGYMLELHESPKQEPITTEDFQNPFADMDPDEVVDRMVDGMGAVVRAINDKGAGEAWKDDGDREKIRDGFKLMFPGLTRNIARAMKPPRPPRYENLVFESKIALIEFLTKEL